MLGIVWPPIVWKFRKNFERLVSMTDFHNERRMEFSGTLSRARRIGRHVEYAALCGWPLQLRR